MNDQDLREIQALFPILEHMIFFNHAGVAPISGPAARALQAYAQQASRQAYVGDNWYRQANQVKASIARLIHARSAGSIAFVPNTSTGLSLVARGFPWHPGQDVVITNVEYPANRYPWEDLKRFGVNVIEVPQAPDGRVYVQDVVEAITDDTVVVAISHVQYASGHRIDLRPIADTVHMAGGYLCVDAIQSVGALPVDVEAMGIDFLSADGHKWMLGPEGCGFFYAKEDLIPLLHPNVVGWMNMVNATDFGNYQFEFQMDARRFEPGSYNIPGILALGASIDLLLEVGIDQVWARIDALCQQLCQGLVSKGYAIFSPRGQDERSGIVIFEPRNPQKRDADWLQGVLTHLEQQGIIIVTREGRLRASPHFYNTPEQITQLVDALPGGE